MDDGGTQILMNGFYQWLETRKVTKTEALRRGQISLVTGKYEGKELEAFKKQTEQKNQFASEIVAELEHPDYWASFILIGNGF